MPTSNEIYEKVREILVDALGADESECTLDATLMGDLGAESIDFLDIVFRLEREFNIKIPRGELFPESIFQGDPEFVQNGKVTTKGIDELRARMPDLRARETNARNQIQALDTQLADRDAYEKLLAPVLTAIAARSHGGPAGGYRGAGGAGHFVKMVHNGIEYGDMQLIAEAYDLLRTVGGMQPPELAEVFAQWNKSELQSFLIEITSQILGTRDELTGQPMVDVILDATGMKVPMATTNLFFDPAFKDGAFTANDPQVRAYALQKTMKAIDLGVELGATTYVFWGGREGAETDAGKDPFVAIQRMRDAINFFCQYVIDNGYQMRFALEPKPNEPRSDIYLPTIGHMLGFIYTLDHPDMVGVNPEVAHEHMANLNFVHGVAQALDAGKLFHIDLNDQKGPRYDQDFRFGSENLKAMFFLVKLLEEKGYTGPRHFDAHAHRTEDEEGVWAFALGCMRTYNVLKEKAKRFSAEPEIQALVNELNGGDQTYGGLLSGYSAETARKLKEASFDIDTLAKRGFGYEKLDQLTIELILGVR